jgi:hypothetical protein
LETSYFLAFNPGIYSTILGVSHQVHAEASHVLYGSHIFDFDQDIESAVPFFSDLTPLSRSFVKHVNITQRALPYRKNFDKFEWTIICEYISINLQLKKLGLGIVGGIPEHHYDLIIYQKSDFKIISKTESMEWIQELCAIKGLEDLEVKTHWDSCPPPVSKGIAEYLTFSASIEDGFAEYLREHLVVKVAWWRALRRWGMELLIDREFGTFQQNEAHFFKEQTMNA